MANKLQAVILAGGLGMRLRSIANDRPKPMVEIAGKPFLEHQIEFLKRYGIADFILCVGYLHESIQEYFQTGEKWGVKIDYAIEEELLGTGGAIKNAEKFIRQSFLALNGDSFLDFNLAKFVEFHQRKKAEEKFHCGTIALTRVHDVRSYGAVSMSREHHILSFEEKMEKSIGIHYINAGIYLLEPAVLDFIPSSRKTSIERETFPLLLQKDKVLFGYPTDGFFIDIGTPAGYAEFQNYIKRMEAWR